MHRIPGNSLCAGVKAAGLSRSGAWMQSLQRPQPPAGTCGARMALQGAPLGKRSHAGQAAVSRLRPHCGHLGSLGSDGCGVGGMEGGGVWTVPPVPLLLFSLPTSFDLKTNHEHVFPCFLLRVSSEDPKT